MKHKALSAAVGLLSVCFARTGNAQTLAIQGDHFTVDGAPKFLVFISYFDGVHRPNSTQFLTCDPNDVHYAQRDVLACDLADLQAKGVSGIRVLTNYKAPYLMSSAGVLDGTVKDNLIKVIDHAAAQGLIVDLTFNHENVTGLTFDAFKWGPGSDPQGSDHHGGIKGVAEALTGRRNVIFDLQNEWNSKRLPPGCSFSLEVCLQDIKDHAVKSVDPLRLVTASHTGGTSEEVPTANFVKTYGFDVLTYHDPRDAAGNWATNTGTVVDNLQSDLLPAILPVYLQEPNRFCVVGSDCNQHPETDNIESHYETAVRNAKRAGAAAWTFHNTPGVGDLSSTTSFQNLLQSGEQTFLSNVSSATNVAWGFGFTDNPIQAPSTTGQPAQLLVKAAHVVELRTRINALRVHFGLGAYSWTDPTLTVGITQVKASHVNELRDRLRETYSHQPLPGLTPPPCGQSVTSGTTILGSHVQDLRGCVITLETYW